MVRCGKPHFPPAMCGRAPFNSSNQPRVMQSKKKQGSTRSRQKSCLPCAKSKVRCSLERPSCSRCITTKRKCTYPPRAENYASPTFSRESRHSAPLSQSSATPTSLPSILTRLEDTAIYRTTANSSTAEQSPHDQPADTENNQTPSLDFSKLDIVPFPDTDHTKDLLLGPFLAIDEQVPKTFHPFTFQYISCVLRTYVKQIAGKYVPPVIHPTQVSGEITSVALANCYSLVRLWHHHEAGSETMVAETIQREMTRLANYVRTYLGPCNTYK